MGLIRAMFLSFAVAFRLLFSSRYHSENALAQTKFCQKNRAAFQYCFIRQIIILLPKTP
jgi:hypothetical protein